MLKNTLVVLSFLSCISFTHAADTSVAEANKKTVLKYYEAYGKGDVEAQAALMSDDLLHEPNQGTATRGRATYIKFAKDLLQYYKEKCVDIHLYTGEDPNRIVAESYAQGKYYKTSEGYPPAKNQSYKIRVVEVFEFKDGKIARLSTHYNDKDWMRQISGK